MARTSGVFHGFTFANRTAQSGITFEHRIVDDAGKNYQAAHYDHGNGLAVADVDGDGRLDIYFTTQLGRNALYRNLGGGQFADITGGAGLAMEDQISVGAAFADVDNDGDPDLFVTTVRHGNRLFRNEGRGGFKDVTRSAGLEYSGHSSGALFFDFDRDGLLDLLLVNVGRYTEDRVGPGGYYLSLADAFHGHMFPERTEQSILYRNLGDGTFKDVSEQLGLRDGSWSGDATFADLDQDGFPELYLVNMQGDDHFYGNEGGKRFLDRTPHYFPKTPWGAMGAKFFDFDQNGLLDLYVTDMHSDMTRQQTEDAAQFRPDIEKKKSEAYCAIQWTEAYLQGASNNIFGNALYSQPRPGEFREVSDQVNVETYWPWGFSVGDVNADGFEDVFVAAGMGYPFRYAVNSLLLNDAGRRFIDAEFLTGLEPRLNGVLGKIWFTLDCDGADKANGLCAGKTGVVTFPGSFSSRSSVFLDLDHDGDLDLVVLDFNGPPLVLISDLSARKTLNFLQVRLEGTRSNRPGLGATVTITAGGRKWTQFHDGKSGYLAQSDAPLYFAFPTGGQVDSIQVRWPSGAEQTVPEPGGARLITIKEPAEGGR